MSLKKIALFVSLTMSVMTVFAGPNEDLFSACKKGDVAAVKEALKKGADVNQPDSVGNTPLSLSFFWPEVVKVLIDQKADLNAGTRSVLYMAAVNGSYEVMSLVLSKGADPNWKGRSNTQDELKKMIKAEKAKGDSANKAKIKEWQDKIEFAPYDLYVLADVVRQTNCTACMEELFKKGAKADNGISNGNLLHALAITAQSKELRSRVFASNAVALKEKGFTVPAWYTTLSEERNGSYDAIINVLVKNGVDINAKDKGSSGRKPQSPLDIVLGGGLGTNEELALAYIRNGANVNSDNEMFGPAFLQAAQCGFLNVLRLMLEKGVDVNIKGRCYTDAVNTGAITNFTALTAAAASNRVEVIRMLLEAKVNAEGISGKCEGECETELQNKSAIYFAIENNYLDLVKMIAEQNGYNGISMIVKSKQLTNCTPSGTYTPSQYANYLGITNIEEYLKSKGL